MAKIIDLTGRRFGKLIVLKYKGLTHWNRAKWECRCDCGSIKIIPGSALKCGDTKSCGPNCKAKLIDMKGERFGKLTVLERLTSNRHGVYKWKCRCDCGNIVNVAGTGLKSGNTRSCGCLHSPDLSGKRFGRLTVIERITSNRRGDYKWRCQCDCGNIKNIIGALLKNGNTRSCGCLQRHMTSIRSRKSYGLAAFNCLYNSYKNRDRRSGRIFSLSKEQFGSLTKQKCFYCGQSAVQEYKTRHYNGSYIYNGLDRLDSSKGYTIDNCVSCCWRCNEAKNDLSLDEFKKWVKKVYEHLIQEEKPTDCIVAPPNTPAELLRHIVQPFTIPGSFSISTEGRKIHESALV